MGAGHYATVADRMHDRLLRPCWGMPQPEKAKPTLAVTGWVSKNSIIHNAPMYIKALAGTQLPICAALRRTGQLEYRAGLLARSGRGTRRFVWLNWRAGCGVTRDERISTA